MTTTERFDPHTGWRKIRLAHRLRRKPYVRHYAEGCRWCDSEGCWLDDYAREWLEQYGRTVLEMPAVPDGLLLTLRPGEWADCPDLPADIYTNVTVVKVHTDTAARSDTWVWVTGHRHPECTWPRVERHPPCVRMRVEVAAIIDCIKGRV